jgi:hypothetical protein
VLLASQNINPLCCCQEHSSREECPLGLHLWRPLSPQPRPLSEERLGAQPRFWCPTDTKPLCRRQEHSGKRGEQARSQGEA